MKDSGILTEAEFAQQKAALLAQGAAQPAVGTAVAPTPPPVQQAPTNVNNTSSNSANNIVVQTVTQGGGGNNNGRSHKYDASMLGGQWADPGDGCCIPPTMYMLTPLGDDAFELKHPRAPRGDMYVRQGATDNFTANLPQGVRMCLFLNENQARCSGGAGLPDLTLTKSGSQLGSGGAATMANQQPAAMPVVNMPQQAAPQPPQPQVMHQPSGKFDPMTGQPMPQVMHQPSGKFDPMTGQPMPQVMHQPSGKFDPMTGKPIPKFDPLTGKQNWYDAGEVRA